MADQSMPYPVIGQFECQREVRLKIGDAWVDAREELGDPNLIWGDNELNLSDRNDILEVDLSLRIEIDITDFLDDVIIEHNPGIDGIQTVDSQLGFLVRWINKGLRRRKAKKAVVLSRETRGTGRGKREFLVGECKDIRIGMAEISGRILFEPILYAKRDLSIDSRAQWRGGPTKVSRGAMVGWGYPLEIILDRRTGQLGSIFRFVWEDFAASGNGESESVFRIEWSNEPTIYLNRGIEELEQVLTNVANTGRVAAIRDAINATVAMQALTVASISALRESEELAQRDATTGEQVLAELSSQNRMFFESFGFLFIAGMPQRFEVNEVVEFLLSPEFDGPTFISAELPIRIQELLTMNRRSSKLLQLLDSGGRSID
jgi:hypothetical protein